MKKILGIFVLLPIFGCAVVSYKPYSKVETHTKEGKVYRVSLTFPDNSQNVINLEAIEGVDVMINHLEEMLSQLKEARKRMNKPESNEAK